MTILHVGFSGGAAVGALVSGFFLAQGVTYTNIYILIGSALVLLAVMTQVVQLPRIVESEKDEKGDTKKSQKPEFKHGRSIVLFTSMMIALCFFIDGSLEGFLSLYLRGFLQSGPLLGGVGIASLHFSAMIGRLSSTTMIKKVGESRI